MTLSNKPMKFLLSATVLAVLAACGGGGDDVAAGDTTGPGSTTAAPDLIFSPAQVTVTPGQEASIAVRVDSGADLRGASFDLPGVQDGVTATFQAAEDGKTGVLKIGASTASAAGDIALTVKGTSGIDDNKVWTGALRVKTSAALTAKGIFVTPTATGSDALGDGSAARPFRTLGKAASMALAGDTINLAAGSFTPLVNGERYPVIVPAGVTIKGSLKSNGAQGTSLSPQTSAEGATGLVLQGDATVKDLEMAVFGTALSANAGTQTVSHLLFTLNQQSLNLAGQASASLKKDTVVQLGATAGETIAELSGQAKLTMDGGVAKSFGPNCQGQAAGIIARESSSVTLKNGARLENVPGTNLALSDSATASLIAATLQRTHPQGCFPLATIAAANSASLNLRAANIVATGGSGAVGIAMQSGTVATLTNSTIAGHLGLGSGVLMAGKSLTVNGGSIKGNGKGISAPAKGFPLLRINGAKIDFNDVGIEVLTPQLTMQNSSLSSNSIGLRVEGSLNTGGLIGLGGVTIGGVPVAGNNVIKGNTVVGVQFFGVGNIALQDNFWNPNTQGADAQGRYPSGLAVRSGDANSSGLNFSLKGPQQAAIF